MQIHSQITKSKRSKFSAEIISRFKKFFLFFISSETLQFNPFFVAHENRERNFKNSLNRKIENFFIPSALLSKTEGIASRLKIIVA